MAKTKKQHISTAVGDPSYILFRIRGTEYGEKQWSRYHGGELPPYSWWPQIYEWRYRPPSTNLRVPWRYIWCGGYDWVEEDGKRVRKFHHFEGKECNCPPGPQVAALATSANEIALGGGRGSAKSEVSLAFLAKGSLSLPEGNPARATYLNSPDYRFLVLRKNAKDLLDYYTRAKRFFEAFGGEASENVIRFPHSGAYGIFDHVADGDAPEKYQGHEYTRIVWEEATQEKDEENYIKILMSCRTSNLDLIPQMLLTANPGGRGAKWFNARFVKLKREDGTLVPPGEVYQYDAGDGEVRTRVFIKSTVDDNPYQLRKGYDKQLELIKEKRPMLYRRWRFGDFDAVDGQYFEEFRDEPGKGEPPEACHVLKCTRERPEPASLQFWWPRAIGLDWGFNHPSAVGWGCWTPKGQLHIYREFVRSQVGTVALGSEIAVRSLPDLEGLPSHHMNIHLSPDAFNRDDDAPSEAEQIAKGIGMVLGRDAVFVAGFNEDEKRMDPDAAHRSLRQRQEELKRKTHLTIVKALNARKAGWQLLHEYLRWWPAVQSKEVDADYSRWLLENKGVLAYQQYKDECERAGREVLPKILFWSCCEKTIEFMKSAVEKDTDVEDVNKQEGDDPGDMLRYLIMGFPFTTAEMPLNVFVDERLAKLREQYGSGISTGSLVHAARQAEYEYQKQHSAMRGFNIPRRAGPTAWGSIPRRTM